MSFDKHDDNKNNSNSSNSNSNSSQHPKNLHRLLSPVQPTEESPSSGGYHHYHQHHYRQQPEWAHQQYGRPATTAAAAATSVAAINNSSAGSNSALADQHRHQQYYHPYQSHPENAAPSSLPPLSPGLEYRRRPHHSSYYHPSTYSQQHPNYEGGHSAAYPTETNPTTPAYDRRRLEDPSSSHHYRQTLPQPSTTASAALPKLSHFSDRSISPPLYSSANYHRPPAASSPFSTSHAPYSSHHAASSSSSLDPLLHSQGPASPSIAASRRIPAGGVHDEYGSRRATSRDYGTHPRHSELVADDYRYHQQEQQPLPLSSSSSSYYYRYQPYESNRHETSDSYGNYMASERPRTRASAYDGPYYHHRQQQHYDYDYPSRRGGHPYQQQQSSIVSSILPTAATLPAGAFSSSSPYTDTRYTAQQDPATVAYANEGGYSGTTEHQSPYEVGGSPRFKPDATTTTTTTTTTAAASVAAATPTVSNNYPPPKSPTVASYRHQYSTSTRAVNGDSAPFPAYDGYSSHSRHHHHHHSRESPSQSSPRQSSGALGIQGASAPTVTATAATNSHCSISPDYGRYRDHYRQQPNYEEPSRPRAPAMAISQLMAEPDTGATVDSAVYPSSYSHHQYAARHPPSPLQQTIRLPPPSALAAGSASYGLSSPALYARDAAVLGSPLDGRSNNQPQYLHSQRQQQQQQQQQDYQRAPAELSTAPTYTSANDRWEGDQANTIERRHEMANRSGETGSRLGPSISNNYAVAQSPPATNGLRIDGSGDSDDEPLISHAKSQKDGIVDKTPQPETRRRQRGKAKAGAASAPDCGSARKGHDGRRGAPPVATHGRQSTLPSEFNTDVDESDIIVVDDTQYYGRAKSGESKSSPGIPSSHHYGRHSLVLNGDSGQSMATVTATAAAATSTSGSSVTSNSLSYGRHEFLPELEGEMLDYMLRVHRRARRAIARYEEYYSAKKRRLHKQFMQRHQDRLGPYLSQLEERLGDISFFHHHPLSSKRRYDAHASGSGATSIEEEDLDSASLAVDNRGRMSLKALDYPILPLSADHYAGEENDETAMEEAEARGGIEVAEDQVGGTLLSLTRQHTKQAEHPAPHQEPGHPTQPTEEELYHQEVAIQKSLFRQIAVMSVPKAWQHMQTNVPIRNNNAKKVAQLCQRELRRVPGKTSARFTTSTTTGVVKPSKELMNRARRTMREMLVFWKRHEREEREARKRAEKEAAERQRQEEEAREARRQQRKLNFLITQTELYSHFIEGKIGDNMPSTDLVDGMQPDQLAGGEAPSFRDLNFDDDNDEKLNERARLSAQNALAKQQSRIRQFDDQMQRGKGQDGDESSAVNVSDMVDSMNLQNPTTMGSGNEVPQPKMLMCKLKEYQLKGLNWLTNLYEQGINGILADEMGLGKTVQSISLLAYLAETHGIFGPFMVVAPASTLHNWQQEISRFVPEFKVLPYWGTQKDRKILRRSFWNTSQLGRRDSPFHVLVTSYQIVVSDENFLNRVKWQYMVLDEAQAIKSSSSTRWKVLLRYHCRNRLLLTGTPIQNSMQELWALLHFIMPSLFDSHEEFGEWFSRDIEAHAEKRGTLNQHQLRRLQVILKPFMLRRIKKHVQHELADKVEHLVPCELTQRQTIMYRGLLGKISVTELLSRLQSTASGSSAKDLNSDADESLMNLVMQFRKVCNHPELFERAEVESPFASCSFPEIGSFSREGDIVQYHYAARNLISYQMPKLLYREGDLPTISPRKTSCGVMDRLFSIWSTDRTSLLADADEDGMSAKELAVLRLCGYSPSQIETAYYGAIGDVLDQFDSVMWLRSGFWQYTMDHSDDSDFRDSGAWQSRLLVEPLNTNKLSLSNLALSPRLGEMTSITVEGFNSSPCKLLPALYKPSAIAPPIEWVCSDHSFALDEREFLFSHPLRRRICPSLLAQGGCYEERPAQGGGASGIEARRRDLSRPFLTQGSSYIWVPSMEKLIRNSGKMAVLDQLLARLKAGGHRVLIYFQMTRMIDLMEEYLAYRQYSYLRLDGSSKISERRDMVTDWQTRPEIFIFLLSTRAGGLGINLTAADTVIFYDSDWNPTVDQQAMDRAHRMGQTKQVTVYRLITRGTIEERILQRARQKDEIHKIVIAGSDPSTTVTDPSKLGQVGGETRSLSDEGFTNNSMEMKSREIVSLLLDETYAKDDEEWSKLLVESRRGLAAGSGDGGDGSHNGEQSSAPPLDTPVVGAADYIFDEHQKRVALAAAAAKMLATNKGKRKARATTATTSNPSKSRGGSGAETPAKRARTATANGPSGNKKKPSGNAAELAMATAPLSNPSTATPCNPDTVPTTPGGGDNNPPEAAAT